MIVFLLAFTAALLGGFVFPWGWVALVGMALGFWKAGTGKPFRIFALSVLGSGLAWGAVAAYYQIGNHGLLAAKVAVIFHLPIVGNGGCLILITAVLGGLTSGFGTLLGLQLRPLWKR